MQESQDDSKTDVESALSLQADRIIDVATVQSPTSMLLVKHTNRQRRNRFLRLVSATMVLLAMAAAANFLQRNPVATVDDVVAPPSGVAVARPDVDLADSDERMLAELIEAISQQTGTQARLVAVSNDNGELVHGIYVPERTVPVNFHDLSPTVQNAVTRVLNEIPADAI